MMLLSRISSKISNLIKTLILFFSTKWKINRIRKSLILLKDADILILGSSPSPVLPDDYRNRLLICCNGSAANAKLLQLSDPVMTVVDYELIDVDVALSKDVRSKIINNKILANLNLGYLVATQSNNAEGGKPELLNAEYGDFLAIDRLTRRKIIDIVTGTNKIERDARLSLCSTGGFAVALSLFLGARSVSIAGFTHLFSGNKHSQMHFYDQALESLSNVLNTRNHSMADSALISLSVINGYKVNTYERDILPLVQNWGNEGPSW
jgi:hypothetical protein